MVEQRHASSGGVNPWLIAITVTLATFMELLDTAIANVALPHIAGGLAVSYDQATWVLTSYLVANAVVLPMSAWLSRVFGRKRYYMLCVGLFTVTSFLCGIAPSLGALIFFRVLQGIGGGGLAPVEQAILVDTFPPQKRASAFALYSIAIVTAPAIGPPLGGWITDSFSWRWVFFINIPIGLFSLFLSGRLVQDPPAFKKEVEAARAAGRRGIDFVGISLIAIGFGCLEVVLDRGEEKDWFGDTGITTLFMIAIVTLVLAVWWELRAPDPVVELRLLKDRNFSVAAVFYFLFGFVLFGSTTMIPALLQQQYGYTATDAGLVLGPGALVITVVTPIVAQALQRFKLDVRKLIAFSFTVVAVSMWCYGSFTLQTDYTHYALARAIQGFGYAFLFVPVSVLAYSHLPPGKNNKGSSLTNLARNWGGSFGVAFVTTIVARRAQVHQVRLGDAMTKTGGAVQDWLHQTAAVLVTRGAPVANAMGMAKAFLTHQVEQQARLLAFFDAFWVLGLAALAGAPLVLLVQKFRPAGGGGGGH